MTEAARGIGYFRKRTYPPRPCAWCKEPIEAPTRTQLTHKGVCYRQYCVNKRQRDYERRKKQAKG
jgi:hypothetical protein